MNETFHLLFGNTGLLSAACWLAAVGTCLIFLRNGRREYAFAVALAGACAGWVFAERHAARVGTFRLDRTDEIRAAVEAQQRQAVIEQQARQTGRPIVLRFAEDAAGEAEGETIMTLSELSTLADEAEGEATPPTGAAEDGAEAAEPAKSLDGDGESSVAELAKSLGHDDESPEVLATSATEDGAEPAYRARGKQTREAGKVDERFRKMGEEAMESVEDEQAAGLMLKLPQYELAKRLNRINHLLADLVLLGVVALVVGDYLRRFNRPLDPYFPLPLAGPWIDTISASPLLVNWHGQHDRVVHTFLDRVVRKGQSFVYFGDRMADDLTGIKRLRFTFFGAWPLPLLHWGRAGAPSDPEFLLDAVWFNRYAAVVPSARALEVLQKILSRLEERAACRCVAPKLPHLVWDTGEAIPPEVLDRLVAVCVETGIRLVVPGELLTASLKERSGIGFQPVR